MSDDTLDTCALCGEPLDDHEDPEDCPVEDDDEQTTEELRAEVAEDVAGAHAFVGVYVQFPRDGNDLDEMDMTTASFTFEDDMTLTEWAAAAKILSDGLERASERHGTQTSLGGPDVQAMAVPAGLGQLLGGGGDDGDADGSNADRRGFQ